VSAYGLEPVSNIRLDRAIWFLVPRAYLPGSRISLPIIRLVETVDRCGSGDGLRPGCGSQAVGCAPRGARPGLSTCHTPNRTRFVTIIHLQAPPVSIRSGWLRCPRVGSVSNGLRRLLVSVAGYLNNMLRRFSRKSAYALYQFSRSLPVLLGFSIPHGFSCEKYTYAFQRPRSSGRGAVTPPSLHRSLR
jgi:hypothetical protein